MTAVFEQVRAIKRECEQKFNTTWEEVTRADYKPRSILPARRWVAYKLNELGLSKAHMGRIMNCDHSTAISRIAAYKKALPTNKT